MSSMLHKRLVKQLSPGYTLMELVVVMLIIGIVGSMSLRVLANISKVYENVLIRSTLVDESRTAALRFYREIKTIPFATSLSVAEEKSVAWGLHSGKAYTYSLNGTTLQRTVDSGSPVVLASHLDVTNSRFYYFDSTGTELTTLPLSAADRQKVRLLSFQFKFSLSGEDYWIGHALFLSNLRKH
ncbi:MAG: type II secretion system GspH family protein [Lentisphaeria bacterium]|nr:type II secretion system GspH family protein [Candidatus Neomarinimicrobiota bacterium]MCF7842506.1 type II secretion system GspH family protein [Lentisphaeria bacterium]